jgi:hypothetical protein
MIKKELDLIGYDDIWVSIALDSLYKTNLPHLNLDHWASKSDQALYRKKIQISIIISTLSRAKNIILYTKLKKKIYPSELVNAINFTKGYLVCFEPGVVQKLKLYKYSRKTVNKLPSKITIKRDLSFFESLDNKNYSHSL